MLVILYNANNIPTTIILYSIYYVCGLFVCHGMNELTCQKMPENIDTEYCVGYMQRCIYTYTHTRSPNKCLMLTFLHFYMTVV